MTPAEDFFQFNPPSHPEFRGLDPLPSRPLFQKLHPTNPAILPRPPSI